MTGTEMRTTLAFFAESASIRTMRKTTLQKILDAASEILYREGPDAVNARAIGRKLKIAPSNVFYYFESEVALKHGLVVHAVTENDQRVQSLTEKRRCRSYLDRLWAHLEGNLAWGRERPDQAAVILFGLSMMEADPTLGQTIRHVLQKGEEKITSLVAMAVADGECRLPGKASQMGTRLHRFLIGLIVGQRLTSRLTLDDEMALIRGYFESFVEKPSKKN